MPNGLIYEHKPEDDMTLREFREFIGQRDNALYAASFAAIAKLNNAQPTKKTPAKKSAAKKTPAKKTPAKKTPAKKTPAKKTPAKKSAAK
jgi:topoisomerase IA-like protein